jgi:hypothetical protein
MSIRKPCQKSNWKLIIRKSHLIEDTLNQFTCAEITNLKSSFTIYLVDGSKHESGVEITKSYFAEMSRLFLRYFTNVRTVNTNVYHIQQVII